jgi:photosystem II stability/assembly factor-like uncharacterized protein
MKKFILFFFMLVSISYSQWEQTSGPKGAHVTVILPHQNGTLYLGTNGNGVFKSTDSGLSWVDISIEQYGVQATCMTYDDQYVYIGTNYYGVFRTSNQGNNWEPTAPVNYNYLSSLYAVQGRVYASSNSYLYVSTDYGNNWTQLDLNKDVNTMVYKSGFLIAGSNNEVFRSSDFGNSWEQSATLFQGLYDPEIITHGYDLYAVGRSALYSSSDNAQTWVQLNFVPTAYKNSITFINNDFFLASDSGLFKSTDFGNIWTAVNLGCQLSMFTRVISAGKVLLTGTYLSIFRSTDNGNIWESANFNFKRESITQVTAYGENVFAAVLRGAYTSSNNGDVWFESVNNRSRHGVTALDVLGNIIFAATYDGRLLKSADNGSTWNDIPNNSPGGFRITALDVNGEQILFGVTRNSAPVGGGIHYSSNNGLNWSVLGGSKYGVSDVAINNNYLYVASPLCLRGRDVSSTKWDTLIHNATYDIEIGNNYIFAYTNQGVKRSSDNGETWIDITNGLDTSSKFNDMLYFNSRLYIAFDSIFISTNNGDEWYTINDGLTDTNITKITANEKYIFAASESGVWRRSIDIIVKAPWKNINIPEKFSLYQNYPNPFNPVTKIKFAIPTPLNPPLAKGGTAKPGGFVKLIVYDILGREVEILINESATGGLKPGTYEVEWNGSNYPSGVYFSKLTAGDFSETKKMVLIK